MMLRFMSPLLIFESDLFPKIMDPFEKKKSKINVFILVKGIFFKTTWPFS